MSDDGLLRPWAISARAATADVEPQTPRVVEPTFPLGMVLEACPDILDYAKGEISNWRDFVAAAAVIRSMLGISPSAWEEAQSVMGERQAATVVAERRFRRCAMRLRCFARLSGWIVADIGDSLSRIGELNLCSARHPKRAARRISAYTGRGRLEPILRPWVQMSTSNAMLVGHEQNTH